MDLTAPSKDASEEIEKIVGEARKHRRDPDTLLDTPSWVMWSFFIDALNCFEDLQGRKPKRVHLTKVQQWMIELYSAKHLNKRISLEKTNTLLGIPLALDAVSFKME